MDQEPKPYKNIGFIVGTIAFIIYLIIGIAEIVMDVGIFAIAIVSHKLGIESAFVRFNQYSLLIMWIYAFFVYYFAVWLGVKWILKRNQIRKDDFLKISIWTGFIFFLLVFFHIVIPILDNPNTYFNYFNIVNLINIFVKPSFISLCTYYWLKKLA